MIISKRRLLLATPTRVLLLLVLGCCGLRLSGAFLVAAPICAATTTTARTTSTSPPRSCRPDVVSPSSSSLLAALTERQQQFWEDVDEGLEEIADYWLKTKSLDIDRIRAFGQSARGEIPPPSGSKPGHEPSEEHIDGLTAKPFWDVTQQPDLFPWAEELEEKSDIIQKEFETNLKKQQFASDSAWQNQVMGEGWSAIRLQRLGIWNADTIQQFPETYKLLKTLNIPLAVRGVCFARQAPQSGVQPHTDGRNFILTSHLGLSVPDGCWIEVGDERRAWQVGKLTTLDTSFTHSTGNPTDDDRHVLILDFWHPELTEAERAALEFIYDLRNKFESGQVPVRKPRPMQEQEDGGLGQWWSNLTGGGS